MAKFDYTLIRSDRKTYSIKITENNQIIVRVPRYARQADVDRLLAEKSRWIERTLAFNSTNGLALEGVRDYRQAYVGGELFPVFYGSRNFIDGAGVHVKNINGFKAAYVASLGGQFAEEFKRLQAACSLGAASVSFRSYKSRWGCCDARDNIVFNFKLLMLPLALQSYVMVHELCHTVFHDHSANFWGLVSQFMPDWKRRREELKRYAFIVRLY